jgi:hypothetical protein
VSHKAPSNSPSAKGSTSAEACTTGADVDHRACVTERGVDLCGDARIGTTHAVAETADALVVGHDSSNSVPSEAGGVSPQCWKPLRVRTRPRGVRLRKPCMIR